MSKQQSQEDLQIIRAMMERSARFISLSGMSGVIAGILALIGGGLIKYWISNYDQYTDTDCVKLRIFLVAVSVLVLSVGNAIYLSSRKSKKNGLALWTRSAKWLVFYFCIPLLAGFLVSCAFYYHQNYEFIIPTTLVFYGLALISASIFTYGDIRLLGISQVILGIVCFFSFKYQLEIWMFGFGVLHIIYGLILYRKYS